MVIEFDQKIPSIFLCRTFRKGKWQSFLIVRVGFLTLLLAFGGNSIRIIFLTKELVNGKPVKVWIKGFTEDRW